MKHNRIIRQSGFTHPAPPTLQKGILAASALFFAVAAPSSAALLAYDGMDYTAASSLTGASGGPGWSNNWGDATNGPFEIQATTLSYGSLVTSPGRAGIVTSNQNNWEIQRGITSAPTTGTLWVSWLFNSANLGSFNQLRLHDGTTRMATVGVHFAAAGSSWQIYDSGFTSRANSGIAQSGVQLAVIGVDLDTNVLNLYINPASLGGSAPATPSATHTFGGSIDFNSLRFVQSSANLPGNPSFDEVRVGTTFAAVTPIPEPSAMGLLGLSTVGIALMRRRK